MEEGVLNNGELDALVEAVAAKLCGIFGVETCDVNDVEIGAFGDVSLDGCNNLFFQFLFHYLFLLTDYSAVKPLVSSLMAGLMVVQMVQLLK